jgi:saccharopine dehydrogenase (NAD+, L-lysine-forming)
MFLSCEWSKQGVYIVDQFNPYPFMEQLIKQGLPWKEMFDIDLEL